MGKMMSMITAAGLGAAAATMMNKRGRSKMANMAKNMFPNNMAENMAENMTENFTDNMTDTGTNSVQD